MILNIISDLHNEFRELAPPTEGDVLILAGDIDVSVGAKDFINQALANGYKRVLYVLGNHEFYHTEYSRTIAEWVLYSNRQPGLEVLHNRTVEYEGVRFIGTTLWTDNPSFGMNEYGCVRYGSDWLNPADTRRIHERAKMFLELELNTPFDGKTVVVTHHAPVQRCVQPKYFGDSFNGNFHANLDYLFEEYDIDLWVHGHMHDSIDFMYHNTRIICNPRGYEPYEPNPNFKVHNLIQC